MRPADFPALVDEASEAAVQGCVLCGADWNLVGMLRPDDFGSPARSVTWEAMRRLRTKGKPVDHLLLAQELRDMGQLQAAGGPSGLMALDQVPPNLANLPAYVAVVRSMAVKRSVQAQAVRLAALAHDPNLTDVQVVSHAQTAFQGLSGGSVDESGDADVWDIVDRWQSFVDGKGESMAFLPHTISGLAPAEDGTSVTPGWPMSLGVLGGQSGVGKTSAAASEIAGFVAKGLPGGIAGLEDGTQWLARRLMARAAGVPFGSVGACRLNDWQQTKLAEWCERWPPIMREKLRCWPKSLDSPQLLAKVEQWKQWGARWVWVDHGLRIRYTAGGRRERLDLLINETTEALAELAMPTRSHPGMAIIINWHLNRGYEEETVPKREHFKEAGYLDANARYMLAVWKRQSNPDYRCFTGVKSNYGPEGWTVEVPLDAEAGLLKRDGGRVVDFKAEAEALQEEKAQGKRKRSGGLF